MHTVGVHTLGVYTIGVYTLEGYTILALVPHCGSTFLGHTLGVQSLEPPIWDLVPTVWESTH